jgi:translation initiation factor 4E
MADVASQNQQVPLDTIPISPVDGSSSNEGQEKSSSNDEVRTVFHDPDNFNVKHPLLNTWTLWFTKPPSGKVRRKLYQRPRWGSADLFRATTGTSC